MRWLQRDPAEYVDGINLYAGYHILWGLLDPTGLSIKLKKWEDNNAQVGSKPWGLDFAAAGQTYSWFTAVDDINEKGYIGWQRICDGEGCVIDVQNNEPNCKIELDLKLNVIILMLPKTNTYWNNSTPNKTWKWAKGHEKNHRDTYSKGLWSQIKKLRKYDGRTFTSRAAGNECIGAIADEVKRLRAEAEAHSKTFDNYADPRYSSHGEANPGRYAHDKFKGRLDKEKIREACRN